MKSKQLISLIIYSFISLFCSAQNTVKTQPFLYNPEISSKIDESKIHVFLLPSINNDSLQEVYKNEKQNLRSHYETVGINIKTNIDVKKSGSVFNLQTGNLWLLKLRSPNAKNISVNFKNLRIPKGASLFIYNSRKDDEFNGPLTLADNDTPIFYGFDLGKELIIEYYEPIGTIDSANIFIEKVGHEFKSLLERGEATPSRLKSNPFGDAINPSCQINVTCDQGNEWGYEIQTVGMVYIRAPTATGWGIITGSGCFINKEDNYVDTDQPYFITAGHILWDIPDSFGLDMDQTLKNYGSIILNYQSRSCNDNDGNNVSYKKITGLTKMILGGNEGDQYDYALLQTDKKVNYLRQYNVNFAGWNTVDGFGSPYVLIHHPHGDLKKIALTASNSTWGDGGIGVTLYWKDGTTEKGSSGAPVFSSTHALKGINVAGENNCSMPKKTIIASLYRMFQSDPTFGAYLGFVNEVDPFYPNTTLLPSHCGNCIRDGDETGIDCGGSCMPCNDKVPDNTLIAKASNNLPKLTEAQKDIVVDVQSGQVTVEPSQDVTFKAGTSIKLKNGFYAKPNSTFRAQLFTDGTESFYHPRDCKKFCIPNPWPNYYPKSEGFHVYAPFVTWFEVYIIQSDNSGNSHEIYHNSGNVYDQDALFWNGSDGYQSKWAQYAGVNGCIQYFWYILTIKDCLNNVKTFNTFAGLDFCKSASEIPAYLPELNNISLASANVENKTRNPFIVYPNPTSQFIVIQLPKNEKETAQKIEVSNLQGQIFIALDAMKYKNSEYKLDLSSLHDGIYMVKIYYEKSVETTKIILMHNLD